MSSTLQPSDLKVRHRKMWASGDYPSVARDLIPQLGERLIEAVGVEPDDRVLDVAAGTGNAAIPAAARGAQVTASDLTPELFDAGRREAAARGVSLTWEEADAEALPYADSEFDVAVSCVGVMFAPHHQTAADELLRVVRRGGRIGVLNWTPEGFIGQLFATMRPFAPPPPAGASPAPLWGSTSHVQELFGDRVRDLTFTSEDAVIAGLDSGASFRDYFKANYGPTIAVYAFLADHPERAAELDEDLAALGDQHVTDDQMQWEYLLATATRA